MRNIYLVAVFIAFMGLFGSCKKDEKPSGNPSIQDCWGLVMRTGGLTGDTTRYPDFSSNTYAFDHDEYKKLAAGQVIKSGHYKIIRDSSYSLQKPADRIIFDNDETAVRTIIQFVNIRMIITEDVNDGFTYEYRKVLQL